MTQKLAIVTGGNRGVGLEVCRQLAGHDDIHVLLTARSQQRGEAAAAQLAADGVPVAFYPLDVTDPSSVRRLIKHVADGYGRADILVNNAGVYLDGGVAGLDVDLALVRQTMEVNFYGPLRLCQMLVPLMQRHNYGRIVNVSSRMGALNDMGGRALAYRTSKAALNVLTRILAAELRGSNILVNSVCPGWVRTDMSGPGAPRSVARGAETIIWLATAPDGSPSGGFYRDRQPIPW